MCLKAWLSLNTSEDCPKLSENDSQPPKTKHAGIDPKHDFPLDFLWDPMTLPLFTVIPRAGPPQVSLITMFPHLGPFKYRYLHCSRTLDSQSNKVPAPWAPKYRYVQCSRALGFRCPSGLPQPPSHQFPHKWLPRSASAAFMNPGG